MIGFGRQVLDMYDLKGGRASKIESLVGQDVDVFRLKEKVLDHRWADWLYCTWPPKYEDADLVYIESGRTYEEKCARLAATRMRNTIDAPYSLRHAVLAGMYSFFQFMIRPAKKECNRHGLHCSQAVSLAYREGGFDLWPAAPDWATLPEHLARSPYLVNLGRLEL